MPYLPGRMKVTELEPNTWWGTDAIDLELGQAVQAAWHQGITDEKDDHQARQESNGAD